MKNNNKVTKDSMSVYELNSNVSHIFPKIEIMYFLIILVFIILLLYFIIFVWKLIQILLDFCNIKIYD